MIRPTHEQLVEMFNIQSRLNVVAAGHSWFTANLAWGRAIRVECAELTDHFGWKWWKHEEPNYEQAALEVVDIWHFMLSKWLVDFGGDVNAAADFVVKSFDFSPMEVIDVLDNQFTLNGLTLHESIDKMSMFASLGYTIAPLFENIVRGCGMDWQQLYSTYVGKNVLNQFRQDHGYKDGTYRKIWMGQEDNVHLARLMKFRPNISPAELYAALEVMYTPLTICAVADGEETAD